MNSRRGSLCDLVALCKRFFKVGLELESGEWADFRSGFGRVCVLFCGE